ncbi:mandelate racemase [Mycobacterium sp. 21AC1]|uniref:enolase C-terminal domain-like protein n=1 Tax=[Mycobacterium] appelbergii TaxID=2939269 RepID=UPI0029394E1F|nr:enolase C-terminal domain-like protein [Mycobacterium sp. 21AC1]MDV3126886.1 mandelate racemase [Mycobacterium sp. 21AC1]
MTTAGSDPMSTVNAEVTDLTAAAYTIPTDSPEGDGTLSWDTTTLIVVTARCGGVTGTGWSYGSAAAVQVVADLLAAQVLGRSALDVTACFDVMVKAVRNTGRSGIAGQAISAVDVALWDLKARLLGLPLHRLLSAVRETVPVYGSGGFTTYQDDQLRRQLTEWTEDLGIPRVKIKIGELWGSHMARDVSRIRQARKLIGDDCELYVDANGGYTAKQAVRMMREAADCNVIWLEEPVSSDDLSGLGAVREAVDADVAAGEYGYDLTYFRRMCEAGAVDCLQADATRCGGITEWLRVAAVAAAHNLQISAHCAPYLHAHVGACVPNLRHLEWFHDHTRIALRFFEGAAPPVGGVLRLSPDNPGHGLTLRDSDIETHRVA